MPRNFVESSSQYIDFPKIDTLVGTVYTFAQRFKIDTLQAGQLGLANHRSTSDTNTALFHNTILTTGEYRVIVQKDGTDFVVLDSTTNPSTGVWHSGIGTRNGDDIELFLDGVSEATGTSPGTMGTITSDDYKVGALDSGGGVNAFMDGDIADVAVWDVILTLDEIKAYNRGVSPTLIRPDNLISYIPLWGTTQEPDLGGLGGIGTLTGSPAVSTTSPAVMPYKKRPIPIQSSLQKKREIEHFYAEQLAEVTQSNTTMTTKLSIPASFFVPFGKYLIITSSQIGADNTTNRPEVQLTFNGAAPLLGSFLDYRMRGTEATRRKIYHDVRVIEADDTPTSFDFQIANSSTSTTRASNTQIFAMRLDKHFKENIDYFYKEEVGSISMDPVTDRNMKSVFTEAFDLGSAEDFHVMGTCRYLTPSTSQRGFINVQDNAVSLLGGGEVANIANTRLNQTYHKIANISSGINHRFNMDAQNGSSGAATFAEFLSVFAIKTAVLEDLVVSNSQSGTLLITGADTYQTVQSGTFTPTPGGAYIVLYAARFVFQSGSTLGSRRSNLRFQLDNVSNPVGIDDNTLTDPQVVDDSPSIPMIAYYSNLPKVSHDWKMEAKNLLANQVDLIGGTVLMFSLLPLRRFSVRGIVTEAGSAAARVVRAFLSSTGEFVGETTSNAGDGAYEICDLPGGDIFVVAFDDSGGSSFNAKIFDKVIPV